MDIRTVQLNENYRIRVTYDECATDPREMQEFISVHTLAQNNRYITIEAGINSFEEELNTIEEYNYNEEELYEAIVKFFTRKNIPYVYQNTHQSTSVWYIEPSELKYFTNPLSCIEECTDEYSQWGRGEVYILTLEKQKTWVEKHNPKNTMHTWEIVESIRDIYDDIYDDDTVRKLAKECFGI